VIILRGEGVGFKGSGGGVRGDHLAALHTPKNFD